MSSSFIERSELPDWGNWLSRCLTAEDSRVLARMARGTLAPPFRMPLLVFGRLYFSPSRQGTVYETLQLL